MERRSLAKDCAKIVEILKPYGFPAAFVVGLPLELTGSEGVQADRVRHFAERLAKETGAAIIYQDERFSSAQGERLLIDGGVRRDKRRGVIDTMAATLILQSYLDRYGTKVVGASEPGSGEPPSGAT